MASLILNVSAASEANHKIPRESNPESMGEQDVDNSKTCPARRKRGLRSPGVKKGPSRGGVNVCKKRRNRDLPRYGLNEGGRQKETGLDPRTFGESRINTWVTNCALPTSHNTHWEGRGGLNSLERFGVGRRKKCFDEKRSREITGTEDRERHPGADCITRVKDQERKGKQIRGRPGSNKWQGPRRQQLGGGEAPKNPAPRQTQGKHPAEHQKDEESMSMPNTSMVD